MRIEVQYYAVLREQAGRDNETVELDGATPADVYGLLQRRHGFELEPQRLKVAVNDAFGDWSQTLSEGDRLVFIPPVAGG